MRLSKQFVANKLNLRVWQITSFEQVDDTLLRVSIRARHSSEPQSFEIDCSSDPWVPVIPEKSA